MQFAIKKVLIGATISVLTGMAISTAASADGEKLASAPGENSATSARFSLQTPIEQLVDDQGARDLLDRVLPGLTSHRMYETFKSMSLEALQAMAPKLLTPERLNDVADGLAQLAATKSGK